MTKKELLKIIKKLPDNQPVYIRVNAPDCSDKVWNDLRVDKAVLVTDRIFLENWKDTIIIDITD